MHWLESVFSIPSHAATAVAMVAIGAYMWLFDEAAARQANVDREFRDDMLGGLSNNMDRNERLERGIAQAQAAGKTAIAVGLLLGAALAWRLLA